MKYSKEQRIEIGRKIVETGRSCSDIAKEYGISDESARRCRIAYEESIILSPTPVRASEKGAKRESPLLMEDYESMSKEELLHELMKSKINEARLKKGYMVKGDGAEKEYYLLNNKNTK